MADIKAQLKTKNGDNLYPVTSMAYVTATFNGGLSFNSSTNTLSTYRIPIASVSALTTSLGAKQAKCSAGFRTEINGATVAQARYFNITSNHSAGALTLSAGCAYRIFATGNAVSLSAETFNSTQFGLEGHATILVTNNSLLTFGSNVVLGQPLVNDAVNNCTLRFHDGHCIIDVEDHDAAHTVTVATGTGSGTLYYYCSAANTTTNETPQFISISDALDGGLVSFNGVPVNGEKHIAGNGTERTSLTSSFTPSSRTYITHAAFNNMTALTGGTVHVTDCAVVAGGTATFSSPVCAYEQLTVNGALKVPGSLTLMDTGVLDGVGSITGAITLGKNCIVSGVTIDLNKHIMSAVQSAGVATFQGATVTNGSAAADGYGVINLPYQGFPKVSAHACVFSGNTATNGGVFGLVYNTTYDLVSCSFVGNSGTNAGAILGSSASVFNFSSCSFSNNVATATSAVMCLTDQAKATFTDCSLGTNQNIRLDTSQNSVELKGHMSFGGYISGSGIVTIDSGADLDLTGNTNSTPVLSGGTVTFKPGSATVHTSDGSAYAFGGFSMSFLPNTNTINFGTSHLIVPRLSTGYYVSNFVFSGGSTTNFGRQLFNAGSFIAIDCTFSGGANGRSGAVTNMSGGKCTLRNCTFVNTTNGNPAGFLHNQNVAGGSSLLDGCSFVSVGADRIAAKYTNIYGTDTISNCVFESGQKITVNTGATVRLAGSNVIAQIDGSGTVIVSSGGVVDLTGNAIESPIAPGGGISVETGGCTIINSAGTSVAIAAGTYTKFNKDGTTA